MKCSIYATTDGKIVLTEVLPYESIVWEEGWQTAGVMQAVFTKTQYVLDAVRVGRWMGILASRTLMYIHSIQLTDTEVWAYGYEAKALFDKCAMLPLAPAGEVSMDDAIDAAITANVPYSWLGNDGTFGFLGTANLDGLEYASVGEFVTGCMKLKGKGWHLAYNDVTNKLIPFVRSGADKTATVRFATVLGNASAIKFTKSVKSYCNKVIALGSDGITETAQESPIIGETYSALLDLREEYPREQGVTEADYRAALQTRAYMSLIARHTTEKVDIGDIDTSQFGTDYGLGDIVSVDIPDAYMTTTRQVTAVKYTIEGGIVKTELTLKEV